MSDKEEFIRRFDSSAKIVLLNELDEVEKKKIPEKWIKVFEQKDNNSRINSLLQIWEEYVPIELGHTIAYLQENLKCVDLMRQQNSDELVFAILYSIESVNGEISYYAGRTPIVKMRDDELGASWDKIPCSIKKFYENVHDGFYDYASISMGLIPIKYVDYLGDEDMDWAIIDELNEPLQINLKTSFGFFINGMGTCIAIDYTNCENDNATWWSAKEEPMYNIHFWSYVDEWIVIGME